MTLPPHRHPSGRFRNPWPEAAGDDALRKEIWRVAWAWWRETKRPDPPPGSLPIAVPDPARPFLDPGGPAAVRLTWIGHSTVLVQLPGLNLLTDPVWSDRSSPIGFAGPHRFVPPPLAIEDLPEIHAVLLSHDHYDHLDLPTVRALHRRFGEALTWLAPLGHGGWFAAHGIRGAVERDWWERAGLPGGRFEAVCVPARHWTRRRPGGTNQRLWCGWVVRPSSVAEAGVAAGPDGVEAHAEPAPDRTAADPTPAGPRVWFAGDSGYCSVFGEIGARLGPFDVSLVPIGGYEPRWFMGAAHMNPEEAVQGYRDAGGRGAFVGIHWGTWRLTFEDPLEPPVRTRAAWAAAGLPEADLHVPRHGETLEVRALL